MNGIPQRTRHRGADPDVLNQPPAPCAALGVDIVLIPPQKRDN
ncbi:MULTISPECIES: hypothetical protein [Nocardia]|nr:MULTISPECIES: hypothetical protein [Nocardia]SFM76698.1 hypothetical protein SAMN05444423_104152 [Nocardia asteroides]VEG33920.1 Uncharacterised protein [Nocardia asteroides]